LGRRRGGAGREGLQVGGAEEEGQPALHILVDRKVHGDRRNRALRSPPPPLEPARSAAKAKRVRCPHREYRMGSSARKTSHSGFRAEPAKHCRHSKRHKGRGWAFATSVTSRPRYSPCAPSLAKTFRAACDSHSQCETFRPQSGCVALALCRWVSPGAVFPFGPHLYHVEVLRGVLLHRLDNVERMQQALHRCRCHPTCRTILQALNKVSHHSPTARGGRILSDNLLSSWRALPKYEAPCVPDPLAHIGQRM